MSLQIINITIPAHELLPDIISTFTPEENILMLKIGSNCLKEGRQAVAGLTQKEIYNKIKDESDFERHLIHLDKVMVSIPMNRDTESDDFDEEVIEFEDFNRTPKLMDNFTNMQIDNNDNVKKLPKVKKIFALSPLTMVYFRDYYFELDSRGV